MWFEKSFNFRSQNVNPFAVSLMTLVEIVFVSVKYYKLKFFKWGNILHYVTACPLLANYAKFRAL